MALLKSFIFPKYSISVVVNSCRNIETTSYRTIDMKWREERGLHKNPNAHGPLTDFPDYTFMNGDRPTPLGVSESILKTRLTLMLEKSNLS